MIAAIAAAGYAGSTYPAPRTCQASGAYPTFCGIPKAPTSVPTPTQIHAAVLGTRLAGRDLLAATAPSTFTLDGTTDFAGRAITEAAPPPPVTTPSQADTEAFARSARNLAKPSKHPR